MKAQQQNAASSVTVDRGWQRSTSPAKEKAMQIKRRIILYFPNATLEEQ